MVSEPETTVNKYRCFKPGDLVAVKYPSAVAVFAGHENSDVDEWAKIIDRLLLDEVAIVIEVYPQRHSAQHDVFVLTNRMKLGWVEAPSLSHVWRPE